MSTAIEQAADGLAKTLHELRTDVSAVKAELPVKIAALETRMTAIQQAAHASARAATEAAAGTNRELDAYVVKSVPQGPDQAQYLRGEGNKAIRLGGHVVRTDVGRGQYVESWQWGLLDDPRPRSKAQLDLQRAVDDRNLARVHMPRGRRFTPVLDQRIRDAAKACGPEIEKIFADSTGIGAEWVPDTYLPELERDAVVPTGIYGLFRQRVLPPGGVKIPQRSGRMRVYRHGVPTSDYPAAPTLSTLTTANSQVDPVAAYVGSQIDRDMAEDSIIPVLQELRMEFVRAKNFAEDDTIINGDTAATHQDTIASWDARGELGSTGLGTSADHRRRWLGLRARAYDLYALDNNYGKTDQSAAKTFAGMRTALAKLGPRNLVSGYMGKSDVIVLVSFEYFFSVLLDSTAFSEFITWEKVGSVASVLSGVLGNVGGLQSAPGMIPVGFLHGFIPVYIAWPITADLETSGLYTVGTGGKTGFLCVDRSRFEYCVREGGMIESETSVLANTETLIMRFRTLFRSLDTVAATTRDVHWSYNL